MAIVTTGIVACLKIPLLIGTSGEAGSQNLSAELNTLFGTNGMLVQILALLPFIVADGLLVRYICLEFDLRLHLVDMAQLQDMQ